VTATAEIASLPDLLIGLPAPVRAAYGDRVLGPLLGKDSVHTALRTTLRAFFACDGSWTRTADALHLHVNTVHYRIRRVEEITGRDLSRLDDRLDLQAALLAIPRAED
jgi:DNA-binding PucR family transcriptional regulator